MSSKRDRRAKAKWSADWRKHHSKYLLTDSDLKICNDVRQQFKVAPVPQRPKLLSKVVAKVVEDYRVRRGLEEVDAFMQERIDKAVRKWIREKSRSRVRAAKIGTKSYSARRVFYQQNKEKIRERAAELQKELPDAQSIQLITQACTEFYRRLSKDEVDGLQTIANEWNTMGPGEQVDVDTGIRAIPKRSLAFFDDCRKQYGAVFFVCYAHKTSNGVESGIMDFTNSMAGNGRSFTAKMKNEIVESGIQELWQGYINKNWGIMEAEQEEGITRRMGKKKNTVHLDVNKFGEPILPDVDLVVESGEVPAEFQGVREYLQTTLRTFLSMHWGLAGPVTSKEPTVPWSAIIENPRKYIRQKYLPDDLVELLKEPSKVVINDCMALVTFWLDRQRRGKDVVFEFSHWRQSRFKNRVPREPRRKVPEIPHKPGFKATQSGEGSGDESDGIQTRSKQSKPGRKASKGKAKAQVESDTNNEGEGDEDGEEVESDTDSREEGDDDDEEVESDTDSREGDEDDEEVESDTDSQDGDEEDDVDDDEEARWADEWQGVSAQDDSSSDSGAPGLEHLAPPPAFGGQGSRIPPPFLAEDSSDSGASSSESSVPPPAFGGQGSRIPPPLFTNRGSSEDEGGVPPAIDNQEVLLSVSDWGSSKNGRRYDLPPSFSDRRASEDGVRPATGEELNLEVPPFLVSEFHEEYEYQRPGFDFDPDAFEAVNRPKRDSGNGSSATGGVGHKRANDGDVEDSDNGPPKKKNRLSNCKGEPKPPSKPQPTAQNPQESPAKNTRSHTVKPRPRKVPVTGTPENLDRRFDMSNQRQTRSLNTPKPPGHYARLNRGATPPNPGRAR